MIPKYQEPSLNGENVAKRRVIKKAKEAFEGEEQRAIKSGQVINEVKTSYKTIVQNLQLQLLTMNLTKSTVLSIVSSISAGLPTIRRGGEYIEGDENVAQGNLHSLLIGSLGKLVGLSSQLNLMCGGLADKVRESGKPITGSADLSKINSLFADVKRAFGFYSDEGFNRGLEQMLEELRMIGGVGVPYVERLVDLYGANMMESERIIGRLQRNEYDTNLESVFIPSRSQNPVRRADIASGTERRTFTGEEYKLLVQLREQGLLSNDDFTSVYSGDRDDSTVASGELEPDEYSYSSIPAARVRRRGYSRDGDSVASTAEDSGTTYYADEGDSDDDTLSTGSGLYSIPPPYRFPQRIF